MNFTFRPLDINSAGAIITWHYEPPYDIYDMASTDPEDTLQYLLDPQNAFHGMYGQSNELEAFCSFGADGQVTGGDYSVPAFDIGLGIRPDLTGQGRGSEFVSAVIDFADQTYTPDRLRVTISAFNRRAQRVWQKAGFQVIQKFQGGWANMDFVVMTKSRS
ncbi:MAG TPA: GNAT family N-acetyltransferase [Anaerolineales bacterium]|nr:GNAT family N-acetyltransferase [Anaerolineales bacterium]